MLFELELKNNIEKLVDIFPYVADKMFYVQFEQLNTILKKMIHACNKLEGRLESSS